MTENKRFKIDLNEEAITDNDEYCLSLYCFQDKGEKDVCNLLNELNEENKLLRCTITEILDFIEKNKGVTLKEMKKWWENKEKKYNTMKI